MQAEEQSLAAWARARVGSDVDGQAWTTVAGDASGRRYFRLGLAPASVIAALSPPASEKNPEFLRVQSLLAAHGVPVPVIHAHDMQRGFFLLQDLGDATLLGKLQGSGGVRQYEHAFALLLQLARVPPTVGSNYDRALLTEEFSRFPRWFLQGLLPQAAAPPSGLLDALCERLICNALEQPIVLVHRDFHSRNLMLQDDGSLALIDFQDAVAGPVTYDLVSLLRDCYVRWPRAQVRKLALAHSARLQAQGLLDSVSEDQFLTWFDLMGLQRHIKVLGTFARLSLRDGKNAYLDDLPLVIRYVREVAAHCTTGEPAIAAFAEYFESLQDDIARQAWGGAL